MKMLVIDDSAIHQATAKAQFKDHTTTVVGTYDEGQELLTPQVNYRRAEAILESQFGNFKPWDTKDETKRQEYYAAEKAAREQATRYPDFDIVLVDLLMPASGHMQSDKGRFAGQEMPVGIFLALLAAKNGAKHVAVFTDSDHHSHPASACFDAFNSRGESNPVPFTVGGAKVVLCNARSLMKYFYPENPAEGIDQNLLSEEQRESMKNGTSSAIRAKDWRGLLDHLMAT